MSKQDEVSIIHRYGENGNKVAEFAVIHKTKNFWWDVLGVVLGIVIWWILTA